MIAAFGVVAGVLASPAPDDRNGRPAGSDLDAAVDDVLDLALVPVAGVDGSRDFSAVSDESGAPASLSLVHRSSSKAGANDGLTGNLRFVLTTHAKLLMAGARNS